MNKNRTKCLSILLCVILIGSLFVGCSGVSNTTDKPVVTPKPSDVGSSDKSSDNNAVEPSDGRIADGNVTLTYWVTNKAFQTDATMTDTPFYKYLEEQTGVKIEFQHPPQGQESEQFNLMIAANDLTDLIETNWLTFPGGPEKAIADNIILNLNNIIDSHALNLKSYLSANPNIDKLVKTDAGNYYVFPFIRGADILMVSFGPHWVRYCFSVPQKKLKLIKSAIQQYTTLSLLREGVPEKFTRSKISNLKNQKFPLRIILSSV